MAVHLWDITSSEFWSKRQSLQLLCEEGSLSDATWWCLEVAKLPSPPFVEGNDLTLSSENPGWKWSLCLMDIISGQLQNTHRTSVMIRCCSRFGGWRGGREEVLFWIFPFHCYSVLFLSFWTSWGKRSLGKTYFERELSDLMLTQPEGGEPSWVTSGTG